MAVIYRLLFCHTCHEQVNDTFTIWEGHNYCEKCFAAYLDMIEERVLKDMEILYEEKETKSD